MFTGVPESISQAEKLPGAREIAGDNIGSTNGAVRSGRAATCRAATRPISDKNPGSKWTAFLEDCVAESMMVVLLRVVIASTAFIDAASKIFLRREGVTLVCEAAIKAAREILDVELPDSGGGGLSVEI